MTIKSKNQMISATLAILWFEAKSINATLAIVGGGAKKCSLYLAKSTIQGAGLGMFTGVPLEEDAYIGFGDPAIPIVDIDFHAGGSKQAEDYHWLISEYVWGAHETGPDMGLEAEDVSAFATGFGSMPNCHFRLKNIAEEHNTYDTAGISRADAGVGASTAYHNRTTYTLTSVEAGQELFVDYGTNWFLSRETEGMGVVPLVASYPKATIFMKSIEKLVANVSTMLQEDSGEDVPESSLEGVMTDLWDIIKQSPYKSRPLSAIPKSFSVAKRAFEVGIKQTELDESIRSLDYLNSHGKCMDHLRPGKSSIPHAGRGAFATRFIPKGGYVSIAPLVHIPDRDVLNLYAEKYDSKKGEVRDVTQLTGHQLLLNYCFGHGSSSLLLCPYSPGVAFINHDSKSPNAKIMWSADPIYHNASWLDEPVAFFDNVWNTGLAVEYVAIKDMNEGDEIVIDYGEEWEESWMHHVEHWQPPEGAETYVSPQQLNNDPSIPIPTYDEDDTLIGEIIDAYCYFSYKSLKEDSHVFQERDMTTSNELVVQRIVDRTELPSEKSHVYTVVLLVELINGKPGEEYIVENVPQNALSFYQKNYQTDMFAKGAFRHEMMIPDEMFPDAWRNIVA